MGNKPVKNYCITCYRATTKRKLGTASWTNQFFSCNKCQNVWCADCMAQLQKQLPSKTWRKGKRGKVKCPICNAPLLMKKLPKDLPFDQVPQDQNIMLRQGQQMQQAQGQAQNITINMPGMSAAPATNNNKFCQQCGQQIPSTAGFCQHCGTKQ